MRLSELKIEQFRGIRDLELSFSSEGILIYGPNGVGKSSILQSIEYLLTSEVNELKGTGTGREPLKNNLWHKDASPEESQVTGTFIGNDDKRVKVRRCVSDGELELLSSHSEKPHAFEALQTAVDSKQNILTRDELLRFIDAADHERSDVLNNILRLEDIDSYRNTVQTVASDFKKEYETVSGRCETLQSEFYDELSSGAEEILDTKPAMIASDQTALEIVNNLRSEYDVEPLSELSEREFTAGITEPKDAQAHPLTRTSTTNRLSRVHEWVSEVLPQVIGDYEDLQDQIQQFKSDSELRRDVQAQDLIVQGQQLVADDGDRCPLCLEDWSERDLRSFLDERRENAEEAADIRDQISSQIDGITQQVRDVLVPLENLIEDLERGDPHRHKGDLLDYVKSFEQFHSRLKEFENELESGDLLDIPYQSKSESQLKNELLPNQVVATLEELDDLSTEIGDSDDKMEAYGTLAIAQDRYDSYRNERDELNTREKYWDVAKQLESDFQTVRSQLLDDTLDSIKEEFTDLLSDITDDVEVRASEVELHSYDDGIKFRPPFHDGETYRPQLFYSEGQQDIMGLALFLAMCRTITKDEVGLVMLDDVLSSVDAEHRSQVATIIDSAYGEEFQFLMTTHDKVWSRHLRQTANIDNENTVHISDWEYESGAHIHIDITDPWENIDYHLRNDDITAAAAWARKTAEFFGAKGCEKFDTEVRFRDIEELSFEDYFQSLMPKLTSLAECGETVNSSEIADESDDGDSVPTVYDDDDLDDLLATLSDMQSIKEQNIWGMHRNVHHSEPERATYSETELRKNIDAFEEVFDVLYCSVCNCWRKETNRGVECECSLLWKTP